MQIYNVKSTLQIYKPTNIHSIALCEQTSRSKLEFFVHGIHGRTLIYLRSVNQCGIKRKSHGTNC